MLRAGVEWDGHFENRVASMNSSGKYRRKFLRGRGGPAHQNRNRERLVDVEAIGTIACGGNLRGSAG